MSIHVPENFYRQTITRAVTLTTGVNIYVSAHPTPAEGYIAISPASTNLREIVYYTAKGTDGNGTYITITTANRGLGGTTAQTHAIGESVRMNVSAETIQEISDALDQIVAAGAQNASTTVKGISKLSVAPASASNPIAVGDNDPRVLSNPASAKFGGTGADGALTIASGATNIDLSSAAVVIKNYTSISITGTGSLTFTNPHANGTIVILKSQGAVTITSSANPTIDLRSLGASANTDGITSFGISTKPGANGSSQSTGAGASSGGVYIGKVLVFAKNAILAVGAGGGNGHQGNEWGSAKCGTGGAGGASLINSGSAGGTCTAAHVDNGTAGAGGRGGGSLLIECKGAYSASSVINASGANGTNGSGTGDNGGGGGGAGGTIVVLYETLTSNTATYTVAGGTGGSPSGSGGGGGSGGNGTSLVAQNTEFA